MPNCVIRGSIASVLLFALAAHADDQQLIEVRVYHFRSAESAKKFDDMMEHAVLPVIKKQGIGPVGIFKVLDSEELDENARVSIVAYDSMKALIDLRKSYVSDPDFWPNCARLSGSGKGRSGI